MRAAATRGIACTAGRAKGRARRWSRPARSSRAGATGPSAVSASCFDTLQCMTGGRQREPRRVEARITGGGGVGGSRPCAYIERTLSGGDTAEAASQQETAHVERRNAGVQGGRHALPESRIKHDGRGRDCGMGRCRVSEWLMRKSVGCRRRVGEEGEGRAYPRGSAC